VSDDPLWYKDALFYELHVKAFQDSNGHGIGDFNGLIQRLDYVGPRRRRHPLIPTQDFFSHLPQNASVRTLPTRALDQHYQP